MVIERVTELLMDDLMLVELAGWARIIYSSLRCSSALIHDSKLLARLQALQEHSWHMSIIPVFLLVLLEAMPRIHANTLYMP